MLEQQIGTTEQERAEWRKKARVSAVTGSCPRSLASVDSGVLHWMKYIAIVHGRSKVREAAFPPRLEDILGWSHTFRPVCKHFDL